LGKVNTPIADDNRLDGIGTFGGGDKGGCTGRANAEIADTEVLGCWSIEQPLGETHEALVEDIDVETEEMGFIVYFFFFLGEEEDEEGCQSCLLKACCQFIIVSIAFNVITAVSQDDDATCMVRDVQEAREDKRTGGYLYLLSSVVGSIWWWLI